MLVKNVQEENLQIKYEDKHVTVDVKTAELENGHVAFNLSHQIVPEQCGCKITPSKVCKFVSAKKICY